MYTITIPVKPYVKKFIIARYRQDTWELNKAERIGKVLYAMLDRMPVRYEKSTVNYSDTLRVEICRDYARNKGIYLSNESIIDFNDYIQLELIEEIAMYALHIKNRTGLKKYDELYVKHANATRQKVHVIRNPQMMQYFEKREIIYDILKQYDISEDDFPFDTVKKACQRYKLPLLSA